MPGSVLALDGAVLRGWAVHPAHASYRMIVHAIAAGRVVATALAGPERASGGLGFALTLPAQTDQSRLSVLLGETGETLAVPGAPPLPPRARVEDLLATPVARGWIDGACVIEGERAGLLAETIIDLLCRDFLGRPAGPVVTGTALQKLAQGGFDAVRAMLIESSEYRHRRIYADQAPGAIFSNPMVLEGAAGDFATDLQRRSVTRVSAEDLLVFDNDAFVTECYRRILRKEPDRAGMAHYLGELASGVSKVAIIRHLSNDFETISAGIVVVDLPPGE